jgi:predicted nucleic-acid-binding protein
VPTLDTNILVRWLVRDDERQTARAFELLQSPTADGLPYFIPVTVLLELECVLRSRYGFAKAQVIAAVTAILETFDLEMQEHAAVERALHMLRLGAAEFADCLHAGLAAQAHRAPMLTFDIGASRLPDAQLI